ncbi:two-component system response regulator [Burkholderia ubonensis]|uniref:LuxR C-terminal-related transcriptional regulator n=1 Tax=Burkholderia ubonensis TaxID=101571 RepID=UPI000759188D|nr:response regulator transcription factor [Burkholderia ubonensis]KVP78109.1 two-component system response regulator [Burkholderia ubonensis]
MLVVDSHPIVRDGIEVVLSKVYEGIDVRGAVDMVEASYLCNCDRPDIVLMDVLLPGNDPLPAMRAILRAQPGVKFMVFTALQSEARAADAIRLGALGYLLKLRSPGDIVRSVGQVMSGCIYIDPLLNSAKIASVAAGRSFPATTGELTRREKQVLTLITEGMRNREIALRLNISQKTVDCHRQRLMQKLGARNVADVIHWAYRYGYTNAGVPLT